MLQDYISGMMVPEHRRPASSTDSAGRPPVEGLSKLKVYRPRYRTNCPSYIHIRHHAVANVQAFHRPVRECPGTSRKEPHSSTLPSHCAVKHGPRDPQPSAQGYSHLD